MIFNKSSRHRLFYIVSLHLGWRVIVVLLGVGKRWWNGVGLRNAIQLIKRLLLSLGLLLSEELLLGEYLLKVGFGLPVETVDGKAE